MAPAEQSAEQSRQEILAEILGRHQPRSLEEMLGPEPRPGDADDLEGFLDFLHLHRRPVQDPDEEEQP